MKYFCVTETIALYIQKYVQYRKRKIFFGNTGKFDDLLPSIVKHKTEKYLVPMSDVHSDDIKNLLDKNKIQHTEVVMYRTVSNDFTPDETFDYDMLVFFSPAGVTSLKKNFPNFEQKEIKIGTCIRMDGKIWTCIDFQHRKPGKGNTVMITKLKNVSDGRVLERTFQIGFKLEDVRVERRPWQYLYEDPTGMIFMNQETFEQIPIARHQIQGADYMKEGDVVEVVTDTSDGTVLLAEMPAKTTLKITQSEPGVKGNTATNATKPATLETGAVVRVPLFINEGETIQVDTRDGSYLGRVNA